MVTEIQVTPKVLLGIPSKSEVSKHLSLKQHPHGRPNQDGRGQGKGGRQPRRQPRPTESRSWKCGGVAPVFWLDLTTKNTLSLSLPHSELKIQIADNPEWGVGCGEGAVAYSLAGPSLPTRLMALPWPTDRCPCM